MITKQGADNTLAGHLKECGGWLTTGQVPQTQSNMLHAWCLDVYQSEKSNAFYLDS